MSRPSSASGEPSPFYQFPADDPSDDIACQAQEDQRDRDALGASNRACLKGGFVGLTLGIGLLISLRKGETRLLKAMRVGERPVAVVLPNGKAGES